MKLYKLTTQNRTTHRGFLWVPGQTYITNGGGDLCGPGWLHAYESPLLAVLFNPIHAGIQNPLLWIAEGGGQVKTDWGRKVGVTQLTLVEQIALPVVTTDQRIAFGILCGLAVCKNPDWVEWAGNWLGGTDRTKKSAAAAAAAAAAAEAEAAYADAARAAAATAAEAAAAAWAADAARAAAAAEAAAANGATIDLQKLAIEALAIKALEY